MFNVKKRTLLLIAGIVWLIAGLNVTRLGIFPDIFGAFFYSGLGCALALAGVLFFGNYICFTKLLEKETAT